MRLIDRMLQILELLANEPQGEGVGAIAARLDLPQSTVHRTLNDLARHGLVKQDPETRKYGLGPTALRYGDAYMRHHSWVSAAQGHLQTLRSRSSESAFLTEFANNEVICVAMAESPRPLKYFIGIGQRMPFHSSASARAILAFTPLDFAQRLIIEEMSTGAGSYPTTKNTPTSVEEILEELEMVRHQNYAVCAEEMEVGVTALAAPIWTASNTVIGSVTVVAPAIRMRRSARERIARLVQETAASISADIGHAPAAIPAAPGD